jgi:hypothetical protein
MTMEEYKQLEDAKNNYESLKREIRGCTEFYEEEGQSPDNYIDLVAEIDLKKLEEVLLRDIDFAEDGDINKIKFKNIKGEK